MSTQLRIETEIARRQAQEGMDRAMDHAEREIPKWVDLALVYLQWYAEKNLEFPGFFVTQAAENDINFPKPTDDRAWGGVWKKAARLGIIKDTKRTMPHTKRHGCPAIIWRSLVFKGSTA